MEKKTKAAKCADLIRKELKEKFPNVKFSVRSETFSMGDAINVKYMDGPALKDVEDILNKYTAGSFNGSIDMYEYKSNCTQGITVKYTDVSREITPGSMLDILKGRKGLLASLAEKNCIAFTNHGEIDFERSANMGIACGVLDSGIGLQDIAWNWTRGLRREAGEIYRDVAIP